MNEQATKELIENEFINILAQKFGISGDDEAVKILGETVFGKQCLGRRPKMNLDKINELVAEKIVGWAKHPHSNTLTYWWEGPTKSYLADELPKYSSDIAAAWEAVEKARESFSSSEWRQFCTELCTDWRVLCGDAPKYIAHAALKAKGIDVEVGE